jgi:hypothetical protein
MNIGEQTMDAVSIRPTLQQPLQTAANNRQTTVEELVNDWLEKNLWEYRHQRIREESERYQALHAELYPQYEGRVIAMLNGEVVDVGDELAEVYHRIRARYGEEPILITKVGPEPIETYIMRSPRLVPPDGK